MRCCEQLQGYEQTSDRREMRCSCLARFEHERQLREQAQQEVQQQAQQQAQQQQQQGDGSPTSPGGRSHSPFARRATAHSAGGPAASQLDGAHGGILRSPPHSLPLHLADRSFSVRSAVAHASAVAHVAVPRPAARRHTAPALRTSTQLGSPELLDQLSSTASRLEALREELERDLQAGQAADGSLALSRLSSMLAACSLLRDASAAVAGSSTLSSGGSAELAPQDSCEQREEGQEVALHDDGAAGVGATAAAAVSVALAQSWAAAAGARQASFRHTAAAEGALQPGKARFKLVAAVPRSYRKAYERGMQVGTLAGLTLRLVCLPAYVGRHCWCCVEAAAGVPLSCFAQDSACVVRLSHTSACHLSCPQPHPSRASLADVASGSSSHGGPPGMHGYASRASLSDLEVGSPATARSSLGSGATPFQSTAALLNLADAEPK